MFSIAIQKEHPVKIFDNIYGADFVFSNEETKMTFFIVNNVLMSFSEASIDGTVDVWVPSKFEADYNFHSDVMYSPHYVRCRHEDEEYCISSSITPVVFCTKYTKHNYIKNNGKALVVATNACDGDAMFLVRRKIPLDKFEDLLAVIHSDYNWEEEYFPIGRLMEIVDELENSSTEFEW